MSDELGQDRDVVSQIVGLIEKGVSTVRDKAVTPITKIIRYVIFGLIVAIVGLMVAILLAITAVRALVIALPGDRAWLAHLITGSIFVLIGAVAMRKRHAPAQAD